MNPLWSKAPLNLVLRFSKIGAAILGASMLLGLVTVAGPMFLASSGSAALNDQLQQTVPFAAGAGITSFGPLNRTAAEQGLTQQSAILDQEWGGRDALGEAVTTRVGPERPISRATGDEVSEVRVMTRTDATSHVDIVAGDAEGTVIADSIAEELGGVEPGTTLLVGRDRTPVVISGIYRALATAPRVDNYWLTLGNLIFTDQTGFTPPAFLIMPEEQFSSLADEQSLNGQTRFEYPLRFDGLTLPKARDLAIYFDRLDATVNEGKSSEDPEIRTIVEGFEQGVFRSSLPPSVRRADQTVTALEGPVLVLSLAGGVVALAVMAAAGGFLLSARRNESILLTARGMGPWSQGSRALVEAAIPGVAGAALGLVAGTFLTLQLGPSDLLPAGSFVGAGTQTAITLAAGLGVLGLAAALTARSLVQEVGKRQSALGRFWWEIPVGLLAAGAFFEISTRDSVIITSGRVDRIDIFVLLFPILFMAAAAGVIGRAMRYGFGKLRAFGHSWPAPAYLANRRLGSAPGSVIGLIVAAVLAVGILIYAQSLASTLQTSTEAKAGVFVGAPVSLTVYANAEIPADFPYPSTKTRRIDRLRLSDGTEVAMLGVDRSNFEAAAYWDSSFSSEGLTRLLDDLEPRPGEPLPVVVVGDGVGSSLTLDLATDAELQAVGRARAFPGLVADTPLLVADVEGMAELFGGASSAVTSRAEDEIWVQGPYRQVIQAAQAADMEIGTTSGMSQVLALPSLRSLSWTFDLLRALGLAAGAVAVAAVLLYVQGRQRSTVVSYALARRMGLGRLEHALALLVELATLIAAAVIAGTLLANASARLLYSKMDLLPDIPPDPLLRIPVLPIVLLAAASAFAAIVGAILVQRAADRARVAEVLRLAD